MNKKTGMCVFAVLLLLNIIIHFLGGKTELNYFAMGLAAFMLGYYVSQEDTNGN